MRTTTPAVDTRPIFSRVHPFVHLFISFVMLSEKNRPWDEANPTNNITKGLFQYQHLPFGISSVPAIFQRMMDSLLQDFPGVVTYLDDVLVTGSNKNEHIQNLDSILSCLESAGVTLKRSKCEFLVQSVEYLGHIIDQHGLHPSPDKIRAIKEAPEPRNITELKSFLGLLNYYRKFFTKSLLSLPSTGYFKKMSSGFGLVNMLLPSWKLKDFYNT